MEREKSIISQQLEERYLWIQAQFACLQSMPKKRMSLKEARILKELRKHSDLHASLVKYYRLQPIQL